jgi:hypothetical protein
MPIMKAVINDELISTQIHSILSDHHSEIKHNVHIDVDPHYVAEIIASAYDDDLLDTLNVVCAEEDMYVRETGLRFSTEDNSVLYITCVHYISGELLDDQMMIHSQYILQFEKDDLLYELYDERPFTVKLLDD